MSVIGFDIGNENSYIAVVKSGGIEILDNEYCLRSTPTYIAFTENGREIGVAARNKVVTNLENTVFGLKKILGKKPEDFNFEKEQAYLPHEICKLPSGDIGIKVSYLKNNVIFSIEQLMAMMLTKLKLLSEAKLGNRIRDCVIAVPTYYTDAQRRAMLNAANIAGLNALKLINESAAVALAYGFFKQNLSEEPQNVVFVDCGNSTLTVTACAFTKDKVKTLGCVWDDIGGRDFDNKLVKYFVDDFKVRYQLDVMTSEKALMSLMRECENLKKIMSTNSLNVNFQIECFMHGKDVNGRMKREVFENLSVDIFNRIEIALRRILLDTQLNCENVHSVEIVGGSCRIPAVKQLIRKVFGREPNATLNQDEAIARGCALQCALLSPLLKTRNFVVEDIPSYIIRIVWKNVENRNEELEVFSFSDKIPACKAITISMRKPKLAMLLFLEARYVDSHGNFQKIGTFTLGNIPKDVDCNEVMKIKLKACLNAHGVFSLLSAKMIGKNVEENSNKSGEEKKQETPMTDNGENVPGPDHIAEEKPCSVVKLHELSINSDVPGLSDVQLNEYIGAEQRMICTDIEEREKGNARNALEEYIYDARAKLGSELYDFVVEEDRKRLLDNLHGIENWLYENEAGDASEYSKRLKEVKSQIEPIFKRYTGWEQKSSVINEYQRALQTAYEIINQLPSAEEYALNDIENVRKMWQNSRQYLDQSIESFSKMTKYDDVTLIVEDLKNSLINFQNEFHFLKKNIDNNIKDVAQKSGDGITKEPGFKNQENNPNVSKEDWLYEQAKEEHNVKQQNLASD